MQSGEKNRVYNNIINQLRSILESNRDRIVAMVTINAVIKSNLPYVYWVGFYRDVDGKLLVGPYQGTLGCLEIPYGKGVCGTSFKNGKALLVNNTHEFEGHIACDVNSKSEIVIPYYNSSKLISGVLDVDSDQLNAFCTTDLKNLEIILEFVSCNG